MPKPFKMRSVCPLPPDAKIVQHEGRPHVRIKDRGRAVLCPLSKDGRSFLRPSKCWYFKIRDANGTVRRIKGFADLKATEQYAAEMERKAMRARAGFSDPAEEHVRRPLTEHLADYAAALEAKGNVQEHNRATVAKISAALTGCGFVFPMDIDAGKLSVWLADLRRPRRLPDLPPADFFSSSEAGKLLGIGTDAVRRFVARHRLQTVGNGPARRLPRATVEAIALRDAQGNSPSTHNHYVRALRSFSRWLARTKRIGSDPLETLSLVNAAVDVRHARRELTADELRRLFDVARNSPRTFRGLTGTARFHLYLTAAGTGFRAKALANLTPADFDLDSDSPTVTLPARLNKSRRLKVQPLPVDVADALREYLAGLPTDRPIWGGTWHPAAAEMLRGDLEASGIPYAVEGPDGPEHADFHALRHSYLTLGGRSGIDLRTLQELAGHSTPTLTARYSHRRLADLAGAVDKLPALVPPVEGHVPLRLAGPEGAKADVDVVLSVPPAVPSWYSGPHSVASDRTLTHFGGNALPSPQPLETTRAGASLHRPASVCFELPGLDSNQDKESQNLLCYRYTTGYRPVPGSSEPETQAAPIAPPSPRPPN